VKCYVSASWQQSLSRCECIICASFTQAICETREMYRALVEALLCVRVYMLLSVCRYFG